MSSVTVSRSRAVRDGAKKVAKQHMLNEMVFIEAHGCALTVKDEDDEGMLYLFKEHIVYASTEWKSSFLLYPVEQVQVESATHEGILMQVKESDNTPRYLRFSDMDRPDEVGRVIHFLKCWKEKNIDGKLEQALQKVPLGGVYARSLMRYPQHHHDLWNLFNMHTILHPPEDRPVPIPDLPGDCSLDNSNFEAVLGHHMCWGLDIHKMEPKGFITGKYDEGLIKSMEGEFMLYLTTTSLCIHGEHKPLPLQIAYKGILSVVEYAVKDEEGALIPAMRLSYVSDDEISNTFILYHFETERAFELCLHETTLSWAQEHNRNYNVGEVFPVLDNVDLMSITMHFRQLDKAGYGIIPKEDFCNSLVTLDGNQDFADIIFEMFDQTELDRVQFSKYLVTMRTLLSGSVEDKLDLIFAMFDYQRQGWFERKELLWILSVMSQPLDPEVREGYTFRDFTRWLFEVMDKNRDGFISHQEFIQALRTDEVVQRAFRTMHLSPQVHHQTTNRRRVSNRYIFMGHPHWNLTCCLQRGIELSTAKLKFVREEEDIDPFDEIIRYDVESQSLYTEPDIEWGSNAQVPEWATDFVLGTKVKLKGISNPMYNHRTGIVTGLDLEIESVIVYLPDHGAPVKVGPQELQILRPAVKKPVVIHVSPGSEIGLSFQKREDGLVLISGVTPNSRAHHAGMQAGHIVESINHYRMPNVKAVENFLYTWRRSGSNQIYFSVVIPDATTEEEFLPGSRVQLIGLQNQASYNGKCGVVVSKEGETIQILLDDIDIPNEVQASNLIPLTNIVRKKVKLNVPPGQDFGFNYDSNGSGAVYVKGVVPKGAADRAGLPVRSIVTAVDGIATPSALMLTRAIEEWTASGSTTAVLDTQQPGAKLNQTIAKTTPTGSSSRVVVSDHCPRVFSSIRAILGITEEDYLHSVGLTTIKAGLFTAHFRGLWEMKPGALWFATHDEQFYITGLSLEDLENFRMMLPQYHDHLKRNPETFLSRYVGLHSMTWNGQEVYFSVMQNAFHSPQQDVHQMVSVSPANYHEWNKSIGVSDTVKQTIMTQLLNDMEMLRDNGICNYVLVVGVHSVTHDDTKSAEHRLRDAEEHVVGNPSWTQGKVLESYQITRKLAPTFSRSHFVPLPTIDERSSTQKHKYRQRSRFNSEAVKKEEQQRRKTPSVVSPRREVSPEANPEGWTCSFCGTQNAWKCTPGHSRKPLVLDIKTTPGCSGCYRNYSEAVLQPGDIMPVGVMPDQGDHVEKLYIRGSVKAAIQPEAAYIDTDDESTEASEDAPEPTEPDVNSVARRRKRLPLQVKNSINREAFQQKNGGFPGATVHKNGILSIVADTKSNLYYFGLVDILKTGPRPDDEERYALSFRDMLDKIFS